MQELTEIHQVVYRAIGDELLWCASMPCRLPAEEAIPLGRYGSSNIGRMKTVYRHGSLASLRPAACRRFAASITTFRFRTQLSNDAYFALIRNFRRNSWLLLYLFGASPAVCRASSPAARTNSQRLSKDTLFLPYATSLRMGRLGYQSDAQSSLAVSYNSLESYATSLEDALTEPYPPYEAIGIRDGDDYRQLATSLLQMENEFYGTIRPKRVIRRGERPLHALRERGVEYVEVRLHGPRSVLPGRHRRRNACISSTCSCCTASSATARRTPRRRSPQSSRNKQRVASRGREPGLRLTRGGQGIGARRMGSAKC